MNKRIFLDFGEKNKKIRKAELLSDHDKKFKTIKPRVIPLKRVSTIAHQPKLHFVPFSYASSSVNEVEILSFLNVHRYVIIGTFKSRKSGKEGRKANREEEKGRKSASKMTNRGERNVARESSKESGEK